MNQPHYLVLVDEKNQNRFRSKAYIAQEEVEIITNVQVNRSLQIIVKHPNYKCSNKL